VANVPTVASAAAVIATAIVTVASAHPVPSVRLPHRSPSMRRPSWSKAETTSMMTMTSRETTKAAKRLRSQPVSSPVTPLRQPERVPPVRVADAVVAAVVRPPTVQLPRVAAVTAKPLVFAGEAALSARLRYLARIHHPS